MRPIQIPPNGVDRCAGQQDRDVVLGLQQVVDEACERGRSDRTDYRRPPDPPRCGEDATGAAEVLRQAGRF